MLQIKYLITLQFEIFDKRFIEIAWHKNDRFLIQYIRYDKLERKLLFLKFYDIILNGTFKILQDTFRAFVHMIFSIILFHIQ